MKTIEKNKSLKNYNTFGVECFSDSFISVNTIEELQKALLNSNFEHTFILGGGSNLLLTQNLRELCIHINIKGISIIEETEDSVIVEAMAGENWHDFVLWTLSKGYGGLENLALIPGNVGAAPIQNIGAYGVELKDSFVCCKTLDRKEAKPYVFNLNQVNFGYRSSIFKTELKNQHIITSVQFRLTRNNHILKTTYGAIQEKLGTQTVTPQTIAQTVIAIRENKLPDPKKIGNSGSFFKNPIITKQHYQKLLEKHPKMPHYKTEEDKIKVPAAWIIETLGYKGYRNKDAGVHQHQALVLVNHGNASGTEILTLAKKIQKDVFDTFNISLEIEVNVV